MALHEVSIINGFGGVVFPLNFAGEPNETKTISITPYSNYTVRSVHANRVDTYEDVLLTETYSDLQSGKKNYTFTMPPANVSIAVEFDFIESIIPVQVTYKSGRGLLYTTSFNLLYNDQSEVSSIQSVSFSEWCQHNDFNPIAIEMPIAHSEIVENTFVISPSALTLRLRLNLFSPYGSGSSYPNYISYSAEGGFSTTFSGNEEKCINGYDANGRQRNIVDISTSHFAVSDIDEFISAQVIYRFDGYPPGLYTSVAGEQIGQVIANKSPTEVTVVSVTSNIFHAADGENIQYSQRASGWQWNYGPTGASGFFEPLTFNYHGLYRPDPYIGYTPANVSGTLGIVDESNRVLNTWTGTLIKSNSNEDFTFYNPILNQSLTFDYEGMDYDFLKRMYILNNGSERITVAFGDYFIVIKQSNRIYRLAYVIS